MPGRVPTLPLFESLRLRKSIAISLALVMHCHAHPWGGGNFAGGRWGGLKAWNDEDVRMMMKWLAFYILFTKGIFRELKKSTQRNFCFCFALRFLLLLLCFCTDIAFDFLHSFLWGWDKLREEKKREISVSLKLWWKTLALCKNLGASQKSRRFLKI